MGMDKQLYPYKLKYVSAHPYMNFSGGLPNRRWSLSMAEQFHPI